MSEFLELLELHDDEPILVPIERPTCACPLKPDACRCPNEGIALWE